MCHLCGARLHTLLTHRCRIPPVPFPPVKSARCIEQNENTANSNTASENLVAFLCCEIVAQGVSKNMLGNHVLIFLSFSWISARARFSLAVLPLEVFYFCPNVMPFGRTVCHTVGSAKQVPYPLHHIPWKS